MNINGKIVWSGDAGIEPGKIYYYFYEVELNTPVPLNVGDGATAMLSRYAVPDPRNHQLEDRGIIDALFTMEVQAAIAPFLNPLIGAIMAGQDVSTVNLGRSPHRRESGKVAWCAHRRQLSHFHGYYDIHGSADGLGVYRSDVNRDSVGLAHHDRPVERRRRAAYH